MICLSLWSFYGITVKANSNTLWIQLYAVADGFIEKGDPDWNGGNQTILYVGHGAVTPQVARSLIKFNLSSVSYTPLDAELRFYINNCISPIDNETNIELHEYSNDSWTEETLCWNNITTEAGDLLERKANFPAGFVNKWWSFDVFSYVTQELSGDQTISFMLKSQYENETQDEHTYQFAGRTSLKVRYPELWLQYEDGTATNPTFSDDFNDNSIDTTKWENFTHGNATVVETEQALNITSEYPDFAGLVTPSTVNVENSGISVDMTNWAIDAEGGVWISIRKVIADPFKNYRAGYNMHAYMDSATTGAWYIDKYEYNGSTTTVVDGEPITDADVLHFRIVFEDNMVYFYDDETLLYNVTFALMPSTYNPYEVYVYLWSDDVSVEFDNFLLVKYWLTSSIKTYNANLQSNGDPYLNTNNRTITQLSYISDVLIFTINAPSGHTSTTTVNCAEKGQPRKVKGVDSWSFDATTNLLSFDVLHASDICVEITWQAKASGYFLLRVHLQEEDKPLRDVTVSVIPLESLEMQMVNATTGLAGVAEFELPYGTYLVKATYEGQLKTMRVWLTGNKDVGFYFGTPPADPRGDLILVAVFVVIIILYFVLFRRK